MAPSADPAPARVANDDSHKLDFTTFTNVINGKRTLTAKARHAIDPATKENSWAVPISTPQDVDEAVAAARTASASWSKTTYEERQNALRGLAAELEKHSEEFARLLVTEQGKPLQWAKMETDLTVQRLTLLAGMSIPEEEVVEEDDERQIVTRYTPLGVVVAIVPWNFPLLLAAGKMTPAVLTGNAVIIKASPFTPYTALKLAELAQSFFPPGVIQALSDDGDLGPLLTAHPGVDKISFTGSSATGKKVLESASKTLKRVTLELGGNDPAIICKSVDIAATAPKIASLAFLNSGQICVALKRIYIHASIYDAFRDAMVAHTRTLQLGPGFAPDVFLGPVQNSMQYERVRSLFLDIAAQKQTVAVGGTLPSPTDAGYFITPTIIDNPADGSRLVTEEPFGPILPILKWEDEEEVIARANDTRMGLGASVWSHDLQEAGRIARRLEAGSVWVNTHMEVSPEVPFGGHKESGIGFEGGVMGLKAYCNCQSLYLKKSV